MTLGLALGLTTILMVGAPMPTGSEITFQQLTNELLPEDKVRSTSIAAKAHAFLTCSRMHCRLPSWKL
jgi:Flp pilus assembly protein CpaB